MSPNNKKKLFNDLEEGKVEIIFEKLNKERRKMICTLNPGALVAKFGTKMKTEPKFDANTMFLIFSIWILFLMVITGHCALRTTFSALELKNKFSKSSKLEVPIMTKFTS